MDYIANVIISRSLEIRISADSPDEARDKAKDWEEYPEELDYGTDVTVRSVVEADDEGEE